MCDKGVNLGKPNIKSVCSVQRITRFSFNLVLSLLGEENTLLSRASLAFQVFKGPQELSHFFVAVILHIALRTKKNKHSLCWQTTKLEFQCMNLGDGGQSNDWLLRNCFKILIETLFSLEWPLSFCLWLTLFKNFQLYPSSQASFISVVRCTYAL